MSRSRFALLWVVVAAVVSGCLEDFDPASKILDARVLGARVEAAGDSTRAWPAPAETASVSLIIVGGVPGAPLDYAFVACPATGVVSGFPLCAGGAASVDLILGSEPAFDVQVPSEVPEGTRLTLVGAVCVNGSIRSISPDMISLADPLCSGDNVDETKMRLEIPIQRGDETNRHPELGAEFALFNETIWAAPPDPLPADNDCASQGASDALPVVSRTGDKPKILIRPTSTVREEYTAEVSDPPVATTRTEELTFSHFADLGELERQFTVINDDNEEQDFDWELPKEDEVGVQGTLVRFYFVVRDGRGGLAFAERVACVTP